jgi:hypothetical protein
MSVFFNSDLGETFLAEEPWSPRACFGKYMQSVIGVCVENDDSQSIGTAFHVGNGVFVTARHVLFGRKIIELISSARRVSPFKLKSGPFFHEDDNIDVAAFVVDPIPQRELYKSIGGGAFTGSGSAAIRAIPLGTHLDDWINDDAFYHMRAIAMGYPPIPLGKKPTLLSVSAEVNGVVDLLPPRKHVHFILSATARGGFSGGPVIVEGDFLLGMTTESLVMNGQPEQLGFFTILGVEPIYECLDQHGILPDFQDFEIEDSAHESAPPQIK